MRQLLSRRSDIPLLLLHLLLFATTVVVSEEDTCKQQSACRCVNGLGSGIDLQDLSTVNYLATPTLPTNITFYFHPCRDVDIVLSANTTQKCESSTLCMFDHNKEHFTSLGKAANTEFHDSVTHERFLVTKTTGETPITSLIQLACTDVEADRLYSLPDTPDTSHYNLILYSRHACMRSLEEDHSLSTGSVLLITFFSLVFAYVVLGMVVNYFLVGARGIEMLPHLGFWRDFPSLVKDGVTFLQNGCNPVSRNDLLTPNTPNPDSYVSI